jgi:sucrose-6-phosphate hydrolase SacC (GH32 family)
VELILELKRGTARSSGLLAYRSPGGQEETRLYVDWEQNDLVVNRARSSLNENVEVNELRAPLDESTPGTARLHMYLDHSIFEISVGRGTALSGRVYPTSPLSKQLCLFSEGGETLVECLNLWELASIWE